MMVAIVAIQEMLSAMAAPMRGPARSSDFDLTSKFDDAVRRKLEEFHRAFRIAEHPGEQLLAPDRHPRPRRSKQRLTSQEEACVHHLALRAAVLELGERSGDVDLLHETVAKEDAEEARAIVLLLDPLFILNVRHILDFDGQQD